jgi:SEC-C motif-containing protein
MTEATTCPCSSKKPYAECCEPLHKKVEKATTAEQLMRARYAAFAKHEIDFIIESAHPDTHKEDARDHIEKWSRDSTWNGMEIIDTTAGGEDDDEGVVEFLAFYDDAEGEEVEHHERAFFKKEDDTWFFVDGESATQEPYVREEPKIGRNEPCPCGSGKKYKKCCGKAA